MYNFADPVKPGSLGYLLTWSLKVWIKKKNILLILILFLFFQVSKNWWHKKGYADRGVMWKLPRGNGNLPPLRSKAGLFRNPRLRLSEKTIFRPLRAQRLCGRRGVWLDGPKHVHPSGVLTSQPGCHIPRNRKGPSSDWPKRHCLGQKCCLVQVQTFGYRRAWTLVN